MSWGSEGGAEVVESGASGAVFSSVFERILMCVGVRRRVRKWWKSGASGVVFSSVFEGILL